MRAVTLGTLARAGFSELAVAQERLAELATQSAHSEQELLGVFSLAADPDSALLAISALQPVIGAAEFAALSREQLQRLALLTGASEALAQFWQRHPAGLVQLLQRGGRVLSAALYRQELCAAITAPTTGAIPVITPESLVTPHSSGEGPRSSGGALPVRAGESGWLALRIRYRQLLSELMLWDLETSLAHGAQTQVAEVTRALAGLADAALETAVLIARATLAAGGGTGLPVQAEHVARVPLAIVAMGKCGAQELNVVSDVDVFFITREVPEQPQLNGDLLLRVATGLARETMRAIQDPALEPPLWEVDANLRPEGKNGPLVRTLNSYLSYYERWAESWEFQALLKARAAAGDIALGTEFLAGVAHAVWHSRSRPDFVGSVQRMRERVTEHINPQESDRQLKLGSGGLRDIEFSVQLLQLVHGAHDKSLREPSTLGGLTALAAGGYIGRDHAEELSAAYCLLRVLEHRLQLRQLRRTALLPADEEQLRILARAAGFRSAADLTAAWRQTQRKVRQLHLKIFYAPLLSAVAALPLADLALTSDAAQDRLRSIGFKDPAGALRHLRALTSGTQRRAQIQRNLLPVLLQWLGDGADPDAGLLAFRRISEANAQAPWYLRLLRDGTEAAERLTAVLAGSRFTAELLEQMPESVSWLESDKKLQPAEFAHLLGEMRAVASRRAGVKEAAQALRHIHKREILRLALGSLSGVLDTAAVAAGLDAAHTALLEVLLAELTKRLDCAAGLDFALIAMGRYGGGELGFASDVDLLAVYRATPGRANAAQDAARVITQLKQLAADPIFGAQLDFDLRPEGKNGALVRNIAGYRSYYEKWSLTWEAQALLRARFAVGDSDLAAEFFAVADPVRYPETFGIEQLREVRLLKARMETERLPRGTQPQRHLKLGPGGVSDTEWLVQLLQLGHAAKIPELRTPHTAQALRAAVQHGLLGAADAATLLRAWELASKLRSAQMLWAGRSSDTLPSDRRDLDGIGRILGRKPDTTTELEEEWFAASRKARRVFEAGFFGVAGSR